MRYHGYMTDKTMAVREARDTLGQIVDAAHYANEVTVITKNGQPRAVVVSYEQYCTLANTTRKA